MADIKVIYKNASGFDQEHSEAADSITMLSFKTATNELTDAKLGRLVDGVDATDEHIHDARYYQESEHITSSAGIADAAKPVITNASGKLDPTLIDISGLDHGGLSGLADDDHPAYVLANGGRDFTATQSYSSSVSIASPNNLAHKKYVDDTVAAAILGQEWMESVGTRAITPPGSPSVGQRVLIDATLGVATGAFAGKEDDVAQWNGSAWIFVTPAIGTFISVDAENTLLYYFGGSAWESKAFESTTASGGLEKLGIDIRIDAASAGNGLSFSGSQYSINVDNASVEVNADILRVKAQGIKDSMIDFGTGAGQVSAADMPIADASAVITATEVEGALQELALSNIGTPYTAGENLVKGDLVYISAANTVMKLSSLSSNVMAIGICNITALSGATTRIKFHNGIISGVLSGATAGQKYYWSGSALTSTIPSGSGSNVWLCGCAKNATDLALEVLHVKKNA
jgi:hypothetical protein